MCSSRSLCSLGSPTAMRLPAPQHKRYDCHIEDTNFLPSPKLKVTTVAIRDDMPILDTKEQLRVSG